MTTGVRALAVLGNEVNLQNTTISLKLFDDDASAPASFLSAVAPPAPAAQVSPVHLTQYYLGSFHTSSA